MEQKWKQIVRVPFVIVGNRRTNSGVTGVISPVKFMSSENSGKVSASTPFSGSASDEVYGAIVLFVLFSLSTLITYSRAVRTYRKAKCDIHSRTKLPRDNSNVFMTVKIWQQRSPNSRFDHVSTRWHDSSLSFNSNYFLRRSRTVCRLRVHPVMKKNS